MSAEAYERRRAARYRIAYGFFMLASLHREIGRLRRPLTGLLRSRLVAALAAPREVDDYLELLGPTWTVRKVSARVVAVQREQGDAVSLWLSPSPSFRGYRAGQHVLLSIGRAGVRHTRCFSLSSAPSEGSSVRISMRAFPEGSVSGWALAHARPGDSVELSQAEGDFVLPEAVPAELLFISAGSGLTPIVSMLRELSRTQHRSRATWLHYGRSETMLEEEALALAGALPWLRLTLTRTNGPNAAPIALRRLSVEALSSSAPAWQTSEVYACGPSGMLETARTIFAAHGRESSLHIESFGEPRPAAPLDRTPLRSRLVFAKSGREIIASAAASLLDQAEAAGLKPAYGCRMGICHTCRCTKLSGAVRNARTGVVSDEPNEEIRLCISTPRSDVTLDL